MAPVMTRPRHAAPVAGAAEPVSLKQVTLNMFRLILAILGFVALGVWVFGYIWISAMACAFTGPNNTSCTVPRPWQLGGEDLWLMVILPAMLVTAIFGLAWLVGGKRQSNDS